MKILLVKQPGEDLSAYKARLDSRGVDYQEHEYPLGGDVLTSNDTKERICAELYKIYREKIDGIQFFLPLKDWDESKRLRGRMFGKVFSSYLTSVTRMRRGYEDTAEHELLHKVDNWVMIYLGISINRILNVSDWDDVVVHGDVPGDAFENYKYDEAWKIINPYLTQALIKRRHEALLGYMEILIIKLRQLVIELQAKVYSQMKLIHPFEDHRLSQAYGIANKEWYPKTGHHIGADYATPEGTPVPAITDGEVVETGFTNTLGYYLVYEYQKAGKTFQARFMHLQALPKRGTYYAGDVIAKTGKTGFLTGPSVHVDIWPNKYNIAAINATNWQQMTVDPETHFTE